MSLRKPFPRTPWAWKLNTAQKAYTQGSTGLKGLMQLHKNINTCDRLALVVKSQWLKGNSTLRNFRKPKHRNRSDAIVITTEE